MSEMTTTDRLKQMAEFMGKTVYPVKIPAKNKQGWKWSYKWKGARCDYYEHQLTYNTSFDSLIEVWARALKQLCAENDKHNKSSQNFRDGLDIILNYRSQFHFAVDDNDCAKAFIVCSDAIEYINNQNK
jgi:hypothetical protein